MVYGFRFRYVPGDPTRRVEESFELEPFASIVRGDPRLTVFQTWVADARLYARIIYEVDPAQQAWYTGWRSASNPATTGVGTASLMAGPVVKPAATRDAIRDAVRNHVRRQEFNRPALSRGAVLIADAPRVVIRSGTYEADVTVLVQIDEIERYELY
jgi:hypothetical protein